MKWRRIGIEDINQPLSDYIEKIIEQELDKGYNIKVCIGTDSQRAVKSYKFATAICVITSDKHGYGKGGIVLGSRYFEKGEMTINQRMLREVSRSISVGYEIAPLLDLYGVDLEIHADINQNEKHASNSALSEAVGWIMGMGWKSRVKPNAYAVSCVADKLC